MAADDVTRFLPCYILRDSSIPCVVWCEDAIGHYGVPTVVFSFHILVPNIAQAAEVLIRRGWHLEDSEQTIFGNFLLRSAHRWLTPPIDTTKEKPAWSLGLSLGRTSTTKQNTPGTNNYYFTSSLRMVLHFFINYAEFLPDSTGSTRRFDR